MQIPTTSAAPYTPVASSGATSLAPAPKKADTAEADFLSYAHMTPAQKMRASILNGMGLTEDDLKAMSTKDRAAVEEKIKEMIRQKVEESTEKKTGAIIDLKA